MTRLLAADDLPEGFAYPAEFLRIVELGLIQLEPWYVFEGDELAVRHTGLANRYPARSLVPFARRQDNDDVACWDLAAGGTRVKIIHDFASPGWEGREEFADFHAWFRQAVDDLIGWG